METVDSKLAHLSLNNKLWICAPLKHLLRGSAYYSEYKNVDLCST